MEPSNTNRKFQLEIVQQPIHARMSGFGEDKGRRPISPLPFVRLRILDGSKPINIDTIDAGLFILQASLHDSQTGLDVTSVNLIGEKFANGQKLEDTSGNLDIWFVYKDLSVRSEGQFFFEFNMICIGW
ncbi:4792_t:CDS:2 [Funneliformis geosporum]|uniref:4977_t:CDS:1 n=1 Tax=Funneliformis geosporum TaxID=1117311 RepID=A0A9W4WTR8_9GLOM|nr:4977_t:CDS:2 [Funneliformis geosporum]CAI2175123.1 4792_t:CDS:2 [Funneliformis geosporum]